LEKRESGTNDKELTNQLVLTEKENLRKQEESLFGVGN